MSRAVADSRRDNRGDIRRQRYRSKEWITLIAAKSRPGARIRLATHRCFILSAGKPILIREVLERAYPKLRRFTSRHYLAARRALRQEAIVIGRMRFGRGRPCLWAPAYPTEGPKKE